jgi:hypothetical protein
MTTSEFLNGISFSTGRRSTDLNKIGRSLQSTTNNRSFINKKNKLSTKQAKIMETLQGKDSAKFVY